MRTLPACTAFSKQDSRSMRTLYVTNPWPGKFPNYDCTLTRFNGVATATREKLSHMHQLLQGRPRQKPGLTDR